MAEGNIKKLVTKPSGKLDDGTKVKVPPRAATSIEDDEDFVDADFADEELEEIEDEEEGDADAQEQQQETEEQESEGEAEEEEQEEVEQEQEAVDEAAEASEEPEELVVEEDAEEAPPQRTLYVDRPNCFRCSHFTTVLSGIKINGKPIDVKPFENCHYSNGNTNCPAREFRVVLGVDANAFARELLEREKVHDSDGLAEMMARLSRYDDTVQENVLTAKSMLKIAGQVEKARKAKMVPTYDFAIELGMEENIVEVKKDGDATVLEVPEWYERFVTEQLGIAKS